MVATLERRLDEMRRYDAVMLSHTGQPYQSHLEAEGRCTNLTTVRQGVEAAGDDIAGPGADDDPAPMQAGASTEDRAARSRERNRLHARRSRQRKKLLMESLKEQCDACSRDIAAIRSVSAIPRPRPRAPRAPYPCLRRVRAAAPCPGSRACTGRRPGPPPNWRAGQMPTWWQRFPRQAAPPPRRDRRVTKPAPRVTRPVDMLCAASEASVGDRAWPVARRRAKPEARNRELGLTPS